MTDEAVGEVTLLLEEWRGGKRQALDSLMPLVTVTVPPSLTPREAAFT